MVQTGVDDMAQIRESVNMASCGEADSCDAACLSSRETMLCKEAQGKVAASNVLGSVGENIQNEGAPAPPKHKARHVTFSLEVERQEFFVSSEEEEEDSCPPRRSKAFRLCDVDKGSSEEPSPQSVPDAPDGDVSETPSGSQDAGSSMEPSPKSARDVPEDDEAVSEKPSGFQSVVPNKRERAPDEDVSESPGDSQTMVPNKQETSPSSLVDRLRAAMKKVRLPSFRASRTSRQVCPESSD
eukprot:TRINITY_DN18213_c0_g1_i2.p1 TRINITY_DN18213_c0_g1~~TRINITY_DN18213_c0_g1_i2.p1  ORF type:complete len:241 (-),score=44.27 TRINITY_DN18213_c0_g1_i2:135-857(-)